MSISSKRHRKASVKDPLDLAELENMSNTEGMLSFLKTTPEEYAHRWEDRASLPEAGSWAPNETVSTPVTTGEAVLTPVDTITHSEPSQEPPPVSTPVETAPLILTPVETRGDVFTPVDKPYPILTPVDTTSPAIAVDSPLPPPDQRLFLSRSKKRLFRPRRASDGHTDGEDRLYQFMWENARQHAPGVRLYAGSMAVLARAVGRNERNTRPLIEALIRKLSIAITRDQDFHTGHPRIYSVYDYSEIANRRKRAGFEWALKNKGIQLLTEAEATALAAFEVNTLVDTYGDVFTPVDTMPSVSNPVDTSAGTDSTPVETAVLTPVDSVVSTPVESSALPYRRRIPEKEPQESSTSDLLVRVLLECMGLTDDDAVHRIAEKCREKAPDATDEEIAYFIRAHAARLTRMHHIENPMGLLITAVPKCFEGESFRQYRQAEEQRKRALARQEADQRSEAEAVLRDPEASEEEKRYARDVLNL